MTEEQKTLEQKRAIVWVVLFAVGTILGVIGGKVLHDKVTMVDRHESEIRVIVAKQEAFSETAKRLEKALERNTESNDTLALLVARLQERMGGSR